MRSSLNSALISLDQRERPYPFSGRVLPIFSASESKRSCRASTPSLMK